MLQKSPLLRQIRLKPAPLSPFWSKKFELIKSPSMQSPNYFSLQVRKKEERRAGRLGLVVRVGGQLALLQLHAVGERQLGGVRRPPGGLPDGQNFAVRLRLLGATARVTLPHGAGAARLPRPLHPRRPLQGPLRQRQSAKGR
jgi:hypothetical protein